MRGLVLGLVVAAALTGNVALAHESWPAYLDLRQTSTETLEVFFRIPTDRQSDRQSDRPPLHLTLPDQARDLQPPRAAGEQGAFVERRSVAIPGGLEGQKIAIDGLSRTRMDVLVRFENLAGKIQIERLTPVDNVFILNTDRVAGDMATAYLGMGIEHILGGIDHLLFVFGILLLVRGWKRVVLAITAFTVAHSLTLAAATLGVIQVPESPLNAAIALSILFLGTEIVRSQRGEDTIGTRQPWLLAFGFGLIHGCGFASGLATTGLPPSEIPYALLFFNIGIEVGQLGFVALYLVLLWAVRTLEMPSPRWAVLLPAYVVGTAGAWWTLIQMQHFLEVMSW